MRYRIATTLLELQRPSPKKFMDDLKSGYLKGFLRILPEDSTFHALVVAASPSPLTLGTPELGDFDTRRGESEFARDCARWTRLRHFSPTLDRLCRLEDLEQCPWGPALAGEPGAVEALLRFSACLPGEPVDGGQGGKRGAQQEDFTVGQNTGVSGYRRAESNAARIGGTVHVAGLAALAAGIAWLR